MKNALKVSIILISIILITYNSNEMHAFGPEFIRTVGLFAVIGSLLIFLFSKRNDPQNNILPVSNPSFLNSLTVYLSGLSTFLIFWDIRVSINPLSGMINDFMLFWLIVSIALFIFPTQYLCTYLMECTPTKSRKILWFTAVISGGYLYLGYVLSGILG